MENNFESLNLKKSLKRTKKKSPGRCFSPFHVWNWVNIFPHTLSLKCKKKKKKFHTWKGKKKRSFSPPSVQTNFSAFTDGKQIFFFESLNLEKCLNLMLEKRFDFFSPSMKKIERLWIKKKVWKRTFIFSPSCWYWLKEWTAPLKKFKLSHDIKYKIQRKDQQWTTEVACLVTFYCTIQQTWDPAQSVSALHQEKKKKKNL